MPTRLDPNIMAVLSGNITPDMLRWLVAAGQEKLGVEVDGIAGAITLATLWARTHTSIEIQPGATLAERALAYAIADIGKGEEGGNNEGPYIEHLCVTAKLGAMKRPKWCAIACSAWYTLAAGPMPLPFKQSAGGRELFNNMAAAPGARIITVPEPGALICWLRRNSIGLVVGAHVALIESYQAGTDRLQTIDGNRNMRGQRFALVDRFPHPQGIWRKDLVGMVAPPR
jgi:hypothetical protein